MPARPVDRCQRPWNKGLLVGQKKPLEPKHVWSIRVRLEIARSIRDLAIFNLAIDSKLRACDLVKLRLDDICSGTNVRRRATIVQKKTGRPVQFEISEQSRNSVEAWLPTLRATGSRYLFPTGIHARPHISIRQYARLVHRWIKSIGLESASYGTHSMRRTKAAQIYRKTGNLRAVQLLLGHTTTGIHAGGRFRATSGTSDRVHSSSPLPKIGGAYALIGSISLKYGNEERPPCGDWPRQNGADRSSPVTKNKPRDVIRRPSAALPCAPAHPTIPSPVHRAPIP